MQNKGLDWRALLNQQPPASSIGKRSRAHTPEQVPKTPGTPGIQAEGTNRFGRVTPPFLFLKSAVPPESVLEAKPPSHQPCESMLHKLAEARTRAASLLATGRQQRGLDTRTPQALAAKQLLQGPLPAPEHVQQDSSCWYECGPSISSKQTTGVAVSSYSRPGPFSRPDWDDGACSMQTSRTGGTAGTSLLSTAHSPSQQWQNALTRLRQLQQRTEEAFTEG